MATSNKAANRAHNRVLRAIKAGEMDAAYGLPCMMCEFAPSEYHHYDGYRWWWKVVPLCRWCHKKMHGVIRRQRNKWFLEGDCRKRDEDFLAEFKIKLVEWLQRRKAAKALAAGA